MNKYTFAVADELLGTRPAIMNKIPVCAWNTGSMDEWNMWESIAYAMANRLEVMDKEFNRVKFFYACGLFEDENGNNVILGKKEIARATRR